MYDHRPGGRFLQIPAMDALDRGDQHAVRLRARVTPAPCIDRIAAADGASAPMVVPMVEIRVVRMLMPHRCVMMPMCVWLPRRVIRRMGMLMMLVVDVSVLMIERVVPMFVFMPLGQMQIEANRHQKRRPHEPHGDGLPKE